jgi:hypothetical protein
LSLPIPDLDNKRFDQLVEEARKLIPGYSSEWTDHNLSDPGITLIDLFAWLSEIALYRANLVTDNHRLKYLKLLGVKPQPPKQAKVDLTFTSAEKKTLSKGTRVSTEINGKEVYFQLEKEIHILPTTPEKKILEKIVVDDGISGIYDRSSSNEKRDLFFAPFGNHIQKGCALYMGFDFINNNVPDTLNLMCYLYEKDLIEIKEDRAEQDYKVENAGLKWEIWTGSKWNPVVPQDETEGFRKSGRIIIKQLEDWIAFSTIPELGRNILKNISDPYFWLRCVVEDSHYEYPPRIENMRLNTVSAIHGMKVKNDNSEMVSNGLPGQVFKLNGNLILDNTLKLSVEEESWVEVDDFEGSGPSDKHFVMNTEKGEIKFGDGLMGLVPSRGSVIKVLEYMIGGGEEGNLMPKSIWKIDGFSGLIINDLASTGGREAQTIEEAIEDFRRDLKTPYTAVTLKDFEQIAISTPGLRIARAKAIPNYDPYNPENSRGSVTVVIIPYTPLEVLKTPPEPSERFKHAVCLHLDKSRLIGTDVHVISPVYIKVSINATIVPMESFRDNSLIMKKVLEKLNHFLHPIKGGIEEEGWPIGRDVYLSELYEIIENIEGVNCVTRLSASGDQGAFTDDDGNLMLNSRLASVYSGIHKVEIVRETDRCLERGDGYSGK